jgi:TRAP-type C4-dicarboxylate transport system permease large subunit
MIGLLTPPMGIGLFVVAKVGAIPLQQLIRAVLPFYVPLLAALALITVFPQITLFLPDLVFGPAR